MIFRGVGKERGREEAGRTGGEWREEVQGIRSINGRYKIHRGTLRIVWEMEKGKNLFYDLWT